MPKICLITGATGGIGSKTAHALAKEGYTLLLVCRDKEKAKELKHSIQAASGSSNVFTFIADLSSQASIRALAESVLEKFKKIDVLIFNAAVLSKTYKLTEDGIEQTFAVNQLSHFLLVNLFWERLMESASTRIVIVSSDIIFQPFAKFNFNDLQNEKTYSMIRAYRQSKIANVLFTYELARRLAGTNITVNCLHPGNVISNMTAHGFFIDLIRPFLNSISAADAAKTVAYLAASSYVEGISGKYFEQNFVKDTPPLTYDKKIAGELWEFCESLIYKSKDVKNQIISQNKI